MKKYEKLEPLWVKSSVSLPIKGNYEAEKYQEMLKKDWEGVAEFERRPINSKFDISRMHYSEIPCDNIQNTKNKDDT